MNIIELQKNKEKAFKYLISKGFQFHCKLIYREAAPIELLNLIGTKRVYEFSLIDHQGLIVDKLFSEYGPIADSWERMWKELVNN